jgi:hypothetical protein
MLHKEMQIGLIQLADAAAQFLPPKVTLSIFFLCVQHVWIYIDIRLSLYTRPLFKHLSLLLARVC